MMAEIIAAIRSLGAIAGLLKELTEEVKGLRLEKENKEIEDFKKGVRFELEQIKVATNDIDRKRLLLELSRRMQE